MGDRSKRKSRTSTHFRESKKIRHHDNKESDANTAIDVPEQDPHRITTSWHDLDLDLQRSIASRLFKQKDRPSVDTLLDTSQGFRALVSSLITTLPVDEGQDVIGTGGGQGGEGGCSELRGPQQYQQQQEEAGRGVSADASAGGRARAAAKRRTLAGGGRRHSTRAGCAKSIGSSAQAVATSAAVDLAARAAAMGGLDHGGGPAEGPALERPAAAAAAAQGGPISWGFPRFAVARHLQLRIPPASAAEWVKVHHDRLAGG